VVNRAGLQRFLFIVLMAGLAIAQPLYALLGRQAEFFVAQGWGATELLLFAGCLSLGLPAFLASLPALGGALHKRLGAGLFWGIAGLLTWLAALPVAIRLGLDGAVAVTVAGGASVVLLLAWRRWYALQLFFEVLSPAILLFPLMFLGFSQATELFRTQATEIGYVGSPGREANVVWVVLDEFPLVSLLTPDLQIDRVAYPNFARLADMANWYVAGTTGADTTVPAVTEALTGVREGPGEQRLPTASNYPRNLFSLLQGRYDMTVKETATLLCPPQACSGRAATPSAPAGQAVTDLALVWAHIVVPRPWSERLPSVSHTWAGFTRERDLASRDQAGLADAQAKARLSGQMTWSSRSAEFQAFIDGIAPGQRPRLFYLHALLPHAEWRYLPDGRSYLLQEDWTGLTKAQRTSSDGARTITDPTWGADAWAVQQAWQRHLLQVGWVDTLLGRLLDRLQAQGMLGDSLLVLMADHGSAFVPGASRRGIDGQTLADIAAVPLFVKLPGQSEGRRVTSQASLIDLLPTLVDALEIGTDWQFTDTSLLGSERPAAERIEVLDTVGDLFTYPVGEHLEHLRARANAKASEFGSGSSADLFAIGPHSDLLGRSPGDFPAAPTADLSVILDSPWLYKQVNPNGEFVPLQVRGELPGFDPTGGPVDLAVGVNGVIRAVTRTYKLPGRERDFSALLPPDALQAGQNRLDIFLVRQAGGSLSLEPLAQAGASGWALTRSNGQATVVDGSGESWPVDVGQRPGRVATYSEEGQALLDLAGSLTDSEAGRVVAFRDGAFAGTVTTEGGSFSIRLPSDGAAVDSRNEVRVYALGKGRAWELAYPDPCSPQWRFAAPADWAGVDCQAAPASPLVRAGDNLRARLDFGSTELRSYLLSGWQRDDRIRWTVAVRAGLEIPLPPLEGPVRCSANVKPFLAPPGLPAQRVYVLANGREVAYWRLDGTRFGPVAWEVPAEVVAESPGSLKLEFLLPDSASPASLGVGSDLRALGLAFSSMELEARAAGEGQ